MKRFSIRALAYASQAVIWLVVVMTIAAERSLPVKEFLAGLTGHHWTAKGLISLVIFSVVVMVFARKEDPKDVTALVRAVLISAVMGAVVIFTFYMLHFFGLA